MEHFSISFIFCIYGIMNVFFDVQWHFTLGRSMFSRCTFSPSDAQLSVNHVQSFDVQSYVQFLQLEVESIN